ncbi:MAG: c-type cytochrome [Anaerolineales bacterium]
MRIRLILGLAALFSAALALTLFFQQVADAQTETTPIADANDWDIANFDQPGQISIFDGPAGISATGKPNELGDYNGDGCGDLAITGHNARGGAGQVRIIFGLCDRWGTVYDLFGSPEDAPSFLNIFGAVAGDMLGTELYQDDFNGDGFDDLLIGAQNATPPPELGRTSSGAAYIVFGAADLAQRETIQMSDPPDNVLPIYGAAFGDRLGIWVEGGDFDGDGFADALIGASQADYRPPGENRANAGLAYVVYGDDNMLAAHAPYLDMAEPLTGAQTRIISPDPDDLLGSTVFGADLNMDGRDDMIVAAALWRDSAGIGGLAQGGGDGPGNTQFNAGDTFVVFGDPALRGQQIDLRERLDANGAPLDDGLSAIYGAEAGDFMGEEIIVGDLNGDGQNDLVLGSLRAPSADNARVDGGEAWVLYLDEDFPGSMIHLREGGPGIPIYAAEPDSKGGDAMLIADMDRDGYDDLLYGAPNADVVDDDGNFRDNAGLLYIIYGGPEPLPTDDNNIIDLLTPPQDLRYELVLAVDAFDMSFYGLSLMDIDNDGYMDFSTNGMNGDGLDNLHPDAGEVYVISGRALAENFGQPIIEAAGPTATHSDDADGSANDPEAEAAPLSAPVLTDGAALYELNCAGCHGAMGEGIQSLGWPLDNSEYLDPDVFSDAELLAFLRQGRAADAPDSKMGRVMPASGGNPSLTDEQMLAIIDYMQTDIYTGE